MNSFLNLKYLQWRIKQGAFKIKIKELEALQTYSSMEDPSDVLIYWKTSKKILKVN